ncbi:hypothetical protein BGZ73_002273 [Actinomortierella ambigua]|nr:hypothetical protein BGZ73_002273 [Actinomortierella ambigua]
MSSNANRTQGTWFRHGWLRQFLCLWCMLMVCLPLVLAEVPPEVRTAGQEYQKLRSIKGHFEDGEFNPEVDTFNGLKYQSMKTVADYFNGKFPAPREIIDIMGNPDLYCNTFEEPASDQSKCWQDGDHIPGGYMIYKWRGFHDYLWFQRDFVTVLATGWYFVFE